MSEDDEAMSKVHKADGDAEEKVVRFVSVMRKETEEGESTRDDGSQV